MSEREHLRYSMKDENIFADRSTDFLHRFKATLISIIGEVEMEISKRDKAAKWESKTIR